MRINQRLSLPRIALMGLLAVTLTEATRVSAQGTGQARGKRALAALSATEWRADIEALRARLPAAHIDLFHLLPETSFHRELDALSAMADTASPERMLVGFGRIVAAVGEGHTSARILDLVGSGFPVRTEVFADGLRIVRVAEADSALLGARVVTVEGRPVEAVLDSVATLVSADNPMGVRPWLPIYLAARDVLAGLGLLDAMPGLTLEVEPFAFPGTVERRRRVTFEPVSLAEAEPMLLGDGQGMAVAGRSAPSLIRDAGSGPYWFRRLPAQRAMFVRIDRLVSQPDWPFTAFVDSLSAAIDRLQPERLILDVRSLSGGNHISLPLIHGLIRTGYTDDRLLVLIGRNTFSAGQNLVTLLGQHVRPVFVGESTGGRPNSYGVLARFTLPNSGLEIRHSRYFIQDSDPADYRQWQAPAVPAPPEIHALLQGRDPALEAALAFSGQLPGRSAMVAVEAAYGTGGIEVALDTARRRAAELRRGQSHVERELNQMGYALLRNQRTEDALAVFHFAIELFPHAWNAWDSLAAGLASVGRVDEAMAAYRRSLSLNGYNDNARRELRLLALAR